jgi:hypothetical protein
MQVEQITLKFKKAYPPFEYTINIQAFASGVFWKIQRNGDTSTPEQRLATNAQTIADMLCDLRKLYQAKEIWATVRDINGNLYLDEEVYNWKSILNMFQESRALDQEAEWDDEECPDSDDAYDWFLKHVIGVTISNIISTPAIIKKAEDLKGKECPVLLMPLTVENSTRLKKCGHYISTEAWNKMTYVRGGGRERACPLCRAPHHPEETE